MSYSLTLTVAKKTKGNPEGKPIPGRAGSEEPDSSPDEPPNPVVPAPEKPAANTDEGESGIGEEVAEVAEVDELSDSDSGSDDDDDGLTEEEEKMRMNEKKEKVSVNSSCRVTFYYGFATALLVLYISIVKSCMCCHLHV